MSRVGGLRGIFMVDVSRVRVGPGSVAGQPSRVDGVRVGGEGGCDERIK